YFGRQLPAALSRDFRFRQGHCSFRVTRRRSEFKDGTSARDPVSSLSEMKPSTYLETSVIGAYLDNGEPFRRDLTIRWWEHELSEYRAVISPLVISELERLAEPHRSAYLKLVEGLEQVELSEEAAILAEGYVSRGIFHRKFIADALHVAVASFLKIDCLVTWK